MENKYYEGILAGSGKGYGFVTIEGIEEDFFIPPNAMFGALDGDKVVIEPTPRPDAPNVAEVKKILEYGNQTIIGNLMYGLMGNYVVADNPRIHKTILVKPEDINKATVGDKVVVKITAQPGGDLDLHGEVIEILGRATERSVLEKAIIRGNKIRDVFPDAVLELAESFGQEIKEADKLNRHDLRKEIIFTIDGEDTRDIDDAISIEKLDNGNYKLGVHIADVGNYVKKDNAIDKEAFARGTSTYLPGYVIPMLPSTLSNGICSLNEGVERLALSCVMEINELGEVVNHDIFESYIKSFARLTYTGVFATLNGEETEEKYQKLADKFKLMEELTLILQKKKDDVGYLEFDLPETHFELNEKGELLSVEREVRTIAHEMIENFMIVANETVAEHFYKLKVPFVYRVHEVPTPEKCAQLSNFMEGLGLNPIVFSQHISPKEYQTILKSIDNEPYEQSLNKIMLRSLQKARYCEQCLGHFGLASTYYCHFTSPIRRYPDLSIHRIIKDYLNKDLDENDKNLKTFVADASVQSSETEKRSEVCERQVDDLKMAEYMQKHLGEVYEGTVCGVTAFGVFVELDNTIEGLIRVENLPDDEYEFMENTLTLKGRSHKYGFGDKVNIRVAGVDLPKRQVDFCEANTEFKEREKKADRPKRPKLDKKAREKRDSKFKNKFNGNKDFNNFDKNKNFNDKDKKFNKNNSFNKDNKFNKDKKFFKFDKNK